MSPVPSLLTDPVGVGMKKEGSPSAKEYWSGLCGGSWVVQPPELRAASSMALYRDGVYGMPPSSSPSFSMSRGKQVETAEEGGVILSKASESTEPNEDSKSVAIDAERDADRSEEPGV